MFTIFWRKISDPYEEITNVHLEGQGGWSSQNGRIVVLRVCGGGEVVWGKEAGGREVFWTKEVGFGGGGG